jgi:hypothetical protein
MVINGISKAIDISEKQSEIEGANPCRCLSLSNSDCKT